MCIVSRPETSNPPASGVTPSACHRATEPDAAMAEDSALASSTPVSGLSPLK